MVMVEGALQRGSFVCTVPYRILFMLFVIYVCGHQNRWQIRVKIVQRISYLHIRCMGVYLVYDFKKHDVFMSSVNETCKTLTVEVCTV